MELKGKSIPSNINLWLDDIDSFLEDNETLNVDLSKKVRENVWLFKNSYESISDYFRKGNISSWWKPEEGKGDAGLGLFADIQKQKREIIENWLVDKKIEKVLDVGAGDGRFLSFYIENFREIVVVELNEKFYRGLKKKYGEQIKLINSDITKIDLKEKFDMISVVDVLVHIEDIPSLFLILTSCLNKGGKLITDITTIEWYKHYKKDGTIHRGISRREFEVMIDCLGLKMLKKVIQVDENGIEQYIIYFLEKL